jgi:ribosomal protein S18 acetylase RimI-like enzyme
MTSEHAIRILGPGSVPAEGHQAGAAQPIPVIRLHDGTDAVIWPLLASDRETVREQYEHLSPESRHHRFLTAMPHLTEPMLDQLVDDVDGVNHVAFVLIALPESGPEVPAGIGRVIRYPDRPSCADVAITVRDEWQGRGVASALVVALSQARPKGIRQIVTTVAADNNKALALLRRIGTMRTSETTPGLLDVIVDLPAVPTADVS